MNSSLDVDTVATEGRRVQELLAKHGTNISTSEAVEIAVAVKANRSADARMLGLLARLYQAEQKERGVEVGAAQAVAAVTQKMTPESRSEGSAR